MKKERQPTRDVSENRFEREEKLGQAPETLPGKSLRDRNANTRGVKLRGSAPRAKAVVKDQSAAPVILPILHSPEKQVRFCINAPGAGQVCVAATFNGWSPTATPLRKGQQGEWEVELKLTPGTHEYRFVVDGQWLDDPLAKGSVPNPYGSQNSVVSV